MTPNKININNLFYIFIISHLIVWTLVPTLTNHNLPLDTIEALAWGSNLDWGYNKHPPVSAWLVQGLYQIFGNQDWSYYFISQLFVVSSFFIVFDAVSPTSKRPLLRLFCFIIETIFHSP